MQAGALPSLLTWQGELSRTRWACSALAVPAAPTAAQAGCAPGVTTLPGLPRELLLAAPLLPVPIGCLLPCTGTASAIRCVVWTSCLPACGSDSHAPQLHQWCAIPMVVTTAQVQMMLVHAVLGALLSVASRATSSPQPGVTHTSPALDHVAGHACAITRCHGHFSHTLCADRELSLGRCIRAPGGACREVGSR